MGGGGPIDLRSEGGPWSAYWRETNLKLIRGYLTAAFLESCMGRACHQVPGDREKHLVRAVYAGITGDPKGVAERIDRLFDE